MKIERRTLMAAIGVAAVAPAARAQQRPLLMMLGYPAGGALDVAARQLAEALRGLGYSTIVENKPGAAGRIALDALKRAKPDGETVAMSPAGPFTMYPHFFKNLRYDPQRDFTAIAPVCSFSFGIAVAVSHPAKTLAEFIAWAKANPASYATPGLGTTMHFIGAILAQSAGIALTHVPYRGGASLLPDVAEGRVSSGISVTTNLVQQQASGRLRLLAITGPARLPQAPDVPTFAELGFADLAITEWFGIFGPAGMELALVARMNADIARAVATPEVKAAFNRAGFTPETSTPQAFAEKIEVDTRRWGPVIKATGYTVDE